jgi:hypothetical protein
MQNTEEILPGIDVLNTGFGDFELRFDPNKPDEVKKAKHTITDMLKRGYARAMKPFVSDHYFHGAYINCI